MKDISSDDVPQVSIYTSNAEGYPYEIMYTLTNPASFTDDALNTFTAPANASLESETDYFVVFENATTDTDEVRFQVGFVAGDGQDVGGASGWSIDTGESYSVLIEIEGSISSTATYSGTTRSTGTDQSASTRSVSTGARAAPASATSHIENNTIRKFEGRHPWVRQAWSNNPLPAEVRESGGPGFYVGPPPE